MQKLGIIFGGKSPEHEISIKSAKNIINACDKDLYEIIPIKISKEGIWDIKVSTLKEKIDIAFPVLHGPYGEDGTIQGLFEMHDIPYIGASVLASSVAMDKVVFKDILKANNLPVTDHLIAYRHSYEKVYNTLSNECKNKIGYPCFVKPSNAGSSIGISKVPNESKLFESLKKAFKYDTKVLIEKYINAREIEVAVLGNHEPETSVPGEIIAADEFYSFDAKYSNTESYAIIPADISKSESETISNLAKKAFKVIDCTGLARVDFFIEKDTEKIYINEINTLPGFTNISMYPMMWGKSGLNLKNLINRLITLAFKRFNEKQSLSYNH